MNGMQPDTIAAIATPSGEGGIAIVRISGPDTFNIIDNIFRCKGLPVSRRASNTFVYGHIVSDESEIDEVLVLIMRTPRSYTCEDMVEIQGHGGRISSRRILRLCLQFGARPAQPGEFTKRAFLNGRIDLTQAEAVADLIHARSDRAANAALEQLHGELSQQVNQLYDDLMIIDADLEASLDFSEEDIVQPLLDSVAERLPPLISRIHQLIDRWDEGHLLRDGASVVIAGRPNTGKSTLLNTLLATTRAIVSHHPGTTRDTIEEQLVVQGIPVRLIDTAGIRDTDCQIEMAGISRTHHHVKQADLVIFMLDAAEKMDEELGESLFKIDKEKSLIIINKQDIKKYEHEKVLNDYHFLCISLKNEEKCSERIKDKIAELLENRITSFDTPHALISERHRMLLEKAIEEVRLAEGMIRAVKEAEADTLLVAEHLRDALEQIGKITGRVYYDELLNQVFSRFCVGK
jgi:tRNA modification GTPase